MKAVESKTRSVIVFGATSYLGSFVIDNLLRNGYRVTAISRDPVKCSILLAQYLSDIEITPLKEITATTPTWNQPAAVINLAYPKDAPAYVIYKTNKRLMEQIDEIMVATSCERLIHISSQAVFGYSFKHLPCPADVPSKRGDPYIETKIQAERLLRRWNKQRRYSLSIVRLGNVIGPGSPTWIGMLAQRMLEERPVGYQNALGFSNSTYSRNAADYVSYLVQQPRNVLQNFGLYHHLAEFFDCRWSQILEYFSSIIGKNFRLISSSDMFEWNREGGSGYKMIKRLKKGKLGSFARMAANRLISERFFADAISWRLKQLYVAQPHVGPVDKGERDISEMDKTIYEIMAEDVPFRPHILREWVAPFSLEAALAEIGDWLRRAGYVVQKDQKLLPND